MNISHESYLKSRLITVSVRQNALFSSDCSSFFVSEPLEKPVLAKSNAV